MAAGSWPGPVARARRLWPTVLGWRFMWRAISTSLWPLAASHRVANSSAVHPFGLMPVRPPPRRPTPRHPILRSPIPRNPPPRSGHFRGPLRASVPFAARPSSRRLRLWQHRAGLCQRLASRQPFAQPQIGRALLAGQRLHQDERRRLAPFEAARPRSELAARAAAPLLDPGAAKSGLEIGPDVRKPWLNGI